MQRRVGADHRKVNSFTDPAIIDELYSASQAGVQIDLIVRGMCSLSPGVPGVSENIRVISIIDRYLEHARIFYFHNRGDCAYWLASADWMPRNFDRRVEIAFPVLDPQHQLKLREILEIQLSDTAKAGKSSLTVAHRASLERVAHTFVLRTSSMRSYEPKTI